MRVFTFVLISLLTGAVKAQSFNFDCDPHGFNSHIEIFWEAGTKRGYEFSESDYIGTIKGVTTNDDWGGRSINSCASGYNIEINLSYWNSASKNQKRRLIFHELGHAILHKDHYFESFYDPSDEQTCYYTDPAEAFPNAYFWWNHIMFSGVSPYEHGHCVSNKGKDIPYFVDFLFDEDTPTICNSGKGGGTITCKL